MAEPHKIYGFVNGGGAGGVIVEALSDEGLFLAQHFCSHQGFGPHDIGAIGDWKHEIYRRAYPDGFEVIWVPYPDIKAHAGIQAAHAAHMAYDPEKYKARMGEIFPPKEAVAERAPDGR